MADKTVCVVIDLGLELVSNSDSGPVSTVLIGDDDSMLRKDLELTGRLLRVAVRDDVLGSVPWLSRRLLR